MFCFAVFQDTKLLNTATKISLLYSLFAQIFHLDYSRKSSGHRFVVLNSLGFSSENFRQIQNEAHEVFVEMTWTDQWSQIVIF